MMDVKELVELKPLAEQGLEIHNPGDPEYRVCHGLLTALAALEALAEETISMDSYTDMAAHAMAMEHRAEKAEAALTAALATGDTKEQP